MKGQLGSYSRVVVEGAKPCRGVQSTVESFTLHSRRLARSRSSRRPVDPIASRHGQSPAWPNLQPVNVKAALIAEKFTSSQARLALTRPSSQSINPTHDIERISPITQSCIVARLLDLGDHFGNTQAPRAQPPRVIHPSLSSVSHVFERARMNFEDGDEHGFGDGLGDRA